MPARLGRSRSSTSDITIATPIDVEVVTGPNSGATARGLILPVEIGSALHCDVVLHEAEVLPVHLRLDQQGHGIVLAVATGDLAIDGRGILACGMAMRATLPITLSLGQARLKISLSSKDTASGVTPSQHPTPKRVIAPGCARAVFWTLLAIVAIGILAQVTLHAPGAAAVASPTAPTPASTLRGGLDTGEALQFLREALARHEITTLRVKAEHAALVVEGTVGRGEQARWQEVRQQFDARYHAVVLRTLLDRDPALRPPALAVAGVRLGNDPYIVDTTGKRYRPGMPLTDGWVVARLEHDAIVLRHGTHEYRLAF